MLNAECRMKNAECRIRKSKAALNLPDLSFCILYALAPCNLAQDR